MITRQQIADIIRSAASDPDIPFPERLAAALDALVLAQFCYVADEAEREEQIRLTQGNAPVSDERRDRSADRTTISVSDANQGKTTVG